MKKHKIREFKAILLDDRTVTIYGNAIKPMLANQVAHQRGGTIAFMELPDVISAADRILESAENLSLM